jgi:carboxypeptidase PM20D1
MAHMDVVPVEDGTESAWTHPPFSGLIDDGFVWGRGTLDDKPALFAILEALQYLLSHNFTLTRTLYVAFGHDEEVGGINGMKRVSDEFEKRNIRFEYVLDEGGSITEGVINAVKKPVALIGFAEKGGFTLRLSAEVQGGHSSMPPFKSSIGIIGAAVAKLEDKQLPSTISTFEITLQHLMSELPFYQRIVAANTWLFSGVLKWIFSMKPSTNAAIRTTTAVTVFNAGKKENVLCQVHLLLLIIFTWFILQFTLIRQSNTLWILLHYF